MPPKTISYDLDLKRDFHKFYKKLLSQNNIYGENLEKVDSYKESREPIIYTSLLNKIPKQKNWIINESAEFSVPDEHISNWEVLKKK